METFFFISLGITFVLILLLVYHFKQRLSTLETKSDTMLDIVNNVVKEMGVIKVIASSRPPSNHPLSSFMENQRPLNDLFSKMSMNNIEVNEININENDIKDVQEIHLAEPEPCDSSDEDDSDEEVSDDESESDKELDSDDEDEKVVVSDDDDSVKSKEEEKEEEVSEEEIEEEKEEEVSEEEIEEEKEEVKVIQVDESSVESIVESIVEESTIIVNKLEPEENDIVSDASSDDPMEEYKKLAPAALKALIISKGYATDVAKMKKPQLLQILEDNL